MFSQCIKGNSQHANLAGNTIYMGHRLFSNNDLHANAHWLCTITESYSIDRKVSLPMF